MKVKEVLCYFVLDHIDFHRMDKNGLHILFCFPKTTKRHSGLEQHEGETEVMTYI